MMSVRLIAGSGRSGTTWVQDALAAANGLRPVFEPLHPHVSAVGTRYAHRALAPNEDHPELEQFLTDICAGRRNRFWTQFRRQRRWLVPPPEEFWTVDDAARLYRRWGKFLRELPRLTLAGQRGDPLVKCIRANLMLGWLSQKLGWKVALIIRHPAAVIESELREGWNAQFALERFRKDGRLHELTGHRFRKLLEKELTPLEALTTRWIIENQWAIEQATINKIAVVFYEWLKIKPESEWERLRLAMELEHVPAPDLLMKPSQQTSPKRTARGLVESDVPRWFRVLTSDQLGTIQSVLDRTGFSIYSTAELSPLENGDAKVIQGTADLRQ